MNTSSRRIGKHRFTLIELLIVVTIIGILIAILLPAISATREKVRRVLCVNNHRQIAIGLIAYTKESDGSMPPGPPVKGSYGQWLIYLNRSKPYQLGYLPHFDFIPDARVLYCPSWTHPAARYDVVTGTMGGWPAPENNGPANWWWSSYGYRTNPEPGRPVSISKDESTLAILTDHWTKRAGNDYGWNLGSGYWGHDGRGYVSTYLDGHSLYYDDLDKEIMNLAIAHTSHAAIETAWEDYFDLD